MYIFSKEVSYLGHKISADGIRPDPGKVKAISDYSRPLNEKQMRSFLGMVGFHRRFIPNFSFIAKPLTNLSKKNAKFIWTD